MALGLLHPPLSQTHILDGCMCPSPHAGIASKISSAQEQKNIDQLRSIGSDPLDDVSLLPSVDYYISILQKCRKSKSLMHMGNALLEIYGNGLDYHEDLGNHLVPTFIECGKFHDAEQVFHRLELRKEHSWTSLAQGSIENGQLDVAFTYYSEMQREGIQPSKHTYVALLNGSARFETLERGQQLHADIAKEGFELFPYVANALVDMYAKCGSLEDATDVHQGMNARDVVTWTSLISGYTDQGLCEEALKCLHEMQVEGVDPNDVTYLCCLKACSALGALQMGQQIYANLVIEEFDKKPYVESALVDMYAKCGLLVEAQELFSAMDIRDTVAWNTLIAGYVEHGFAKEALRSLEQMEAEGLTPDVATYTCSLKACGNLRAVDKGRELHSEAVIKELEKNEFMGSALVDMYAKCGALLEAKDVLEELPTREVVSWTALVAGIAECRQPNEAFYTLQQMQADGVISDVVSWSAVMLSFVEEGENERVIELFLQMQEQGIAPNRVTFISILKACGNLGALQFGKMLHARISGFSMLEVTALLMETTIMDMYADCGSMDCATDVFNAILLKDQASWNAFIQGHVRQGNRESVFYLNEKAKFSGIKEDEIAMANILTICSHAGMVEEGELVFESLIEFPDIQLQNCVVSLFCQAGQLDVVVALIEIMPLCTDSVTWATLLGACQKWGDLKLGSWILKLASNVLANEAVPFLSLSNIILDSRNWSDE